MKKAIMLISIMTLIILSQLYCVNHMDLIQTMTGEFNGSEFGFNMASIDFNADGYDDLVISSSAWNPNGVYNESQLFGKLYFYWGGPGFDNVPDMVISGTHYLHYNGKSLFNAGDINGDGYDDLVIANRDSLGVNSVEIYYSRNNPQTIPDITLSYPLSLTANIYAFPLGDINGDNHADLGFGFSEESQRYGRRVMILTDMTSQPMLFRESNNVMGAPLISGVGDVNYDGIDDFYLYYPINGINSTTNNRLVLYYGSASFPVMDSLVITEDTQSTSFRWGNPVGDVNGDGIGDFVGYHRYLWFGNVNLTTDWDLQMSSQYGTSENYYQYTFQHGDFNNDGYADIVSGNIYDGGYTGVVNVWLGRQQMNGTVDLNLWNPVYTEHCNFSWAKAVGDFNADGFDDLAVSAPWWNYNDHMRPGKVFIFAGNTELEDTTVANQDNIIPSADLTGWEIMIYPNPVNSRTTKLNVKLVGSSYKTVKNLKVEVFNVKGQKLSSKPINSNDIIAGFVDIVLKDHAPGCYLAAIKANNQLVNTVEFTIKSK